MKKTFLFSSWDKYQEFKSKVGVDLFYRLLISVVGGGDDSLFVTFRFRDYYHLVRFNDVYRLVNYY